MIPLTKKTIILSSCLLSLSALTAQTATASSSYSSSAEIQYSISASNRNGSGTLLDLDISDFIDPYPGTESLTSTYNPDIYDPYNGLNINHTNKLSAQDNISDGSATSEYFSDFQLDFKNVSSDTNDIFDITINYTYTLSAQSLGENANTSISIEAYNGNDDWLGGDVLETSTNVLPNIDQLIFSDTFDFTLAANQQESIYLYTFISGNLEATSVAPVPLPAAFWMFGSALMVFPSIRKLQKKAA